MFNGYLIREVLEAHVFASCMNVIAGEGEDAAEDAEEAAAEVDHPVKRPAEEEVQFCPILNPSIYNSLTVKVEPSLLLF